MNIQERTRSIAFLPQQCQERENESTYSLLQETGYFELADQISADTIREVLAKYPECVGLWLQWSEDKRTRTGWYFRRESQSKYIVAYLSITGETQASEFADAITACSVFIKREIEQIRTS